MALGRKGPVGLARRWWPLPVAIAVGLIMQALFQARYDVSGHAAEHLSSASAPFPALAAVSVLLWSTPPARRQADVVMACAAWLVGTALVLVGNMRVVDDLVDAGLAHAPTGNIPDVADHGLANLAPWLAVGAAVVLTAVMWRRHHVSGRVALGAGVLSVLFPPWIIPGAGVIVLTVARCVGFARTSDHVAEWSTDATRSAS